MIEKREQLNVATIHSTLVLLHLQCSKPEQTTNFQHVMYQNQLIYQRF